jgi:hypothetical protein
VDKNFYSCRKWVLQLSMIFWLIKAVNLRGIK